MAVAKDGRLLLKQKKTGLETPPNRPPEDSRPLSVVNPDQVGGCTEFHRREGGFLPTAGRGPDRKVVRGIDEYKKKSVSQKCACNEYLVCVLGQDIQHKLNNHFLFSV